MNIFEFTEKFQAMEMDEKLFEMSTEDDIFYWDIIRYELFNTIFRDYLRGSIESKKVIVNNKFEPSLKKILEIFRNVINDFVYLHNNKESPYVIFTCSRNLIAGEEKDIISEDYLKTIGNRSFIIETFSTSRKIKNYKNTILTYRKKLYRLSRFKQKFPVNEIINDRFNINIDLNEIINKKLYEFRIEKKYYQNLLEKINPNAVFFVQNGIQKALIHSCKKLHIPLVEFQHGIINFCHPAYSYPNGIEKYLSKEIIVPDVLFGLSDYWIQNVNYPVKESISMGNSNFNKSGQPVEKERKEITFISANIYQGKIEVYLKTLLENSQDIIINLKLHPNQYSELNDIIRKFSKYSNLNIYSNELSLDELFRRSIEVIVVTSTAAYEALQAGCNLGIIQDDSSYDIADLFRHPNVRVISEPMDILNSNFGAHIETSFFNLFDNEKFTRFIEKFEKG